MVWLVIVLVLVCLSLILGIYTLEKNLRQAREQLEQVRAGETGVRLTLDTPNRQAEELFHTINALLEQRELERVDYQRKERQLRQQIANVSHDLRTPLTSILGYLQLLREEGLSPEERRAWLEVIDGRAQSLRELITAFYDLSRIEGGEYPLEREQVELRRELEEVLAGFYPELEKSGLTVSVDLARDIPPVWGDRGGVRRVFSNLLVNALRHGQGTLEVKLERRGAWAAASFTNGAPDMTQEDVLHVFERSFTADRTRTGQNTGLGLSIVQALMVQMGHQVRPELREGRFTIETLWTLGGSGGQQAPEV